MNQNNSRDELAKELRMVANMINMSERIRWGQETTLMDRAANMLDTHHQELQKAREEMRQETMRKVMSKLRNQFNSEDDELSLEEIEVALYELDHSELDQPTSVTGE